jgi:amino acid adenylation domain-containing protein
VTNRLAMEHELELLPLPAVIDAELATEKAYWMERLSGDIVASGIPLDFRRPEELVISMGAVRIKIDHATEAALLRISNNKAELCFAILVAALKICLYKYTRLEDVIVGTAIHERYKEVSALNKVLALRDRVIDGMSVRELLQAVKRTLAEAYSNQKYPIERILELLNIPTARNRDPFFRTVVLLDNINNKKNVEDLMSDLRVIFSIAAGSVSGSVEYNAAVLRQETMETFAAHYEKVLRAALEAPDSKISELDLLSGRERAKLVFGFNDTRAEYPSHKGVHELLREQASKTPSSTAVVFENEHLTYYELDSRSSRLARHLRELGVGPDTPVAVFLERSLETVVAFLAVLKAGGAYVPLDPIYSRQRLSSILDDARPPVLLTQQGLVEGLTNTPDTVLCVDTEWGAVAARDDADLASAVSADNLAYIIYTSGSTGLPKGVMITHGSLCNHMVWMQRDFPFSPGDRVLQKTPCTFDASVWEFYAPLLVGAQLVMARSGGEMDGAYLVKVITEEQISTLQLVPTMLQLFLEQETLEECISLRRVFCGGEALTGELQDRFFARLDADLVNLYGPTEATVQTVVWPCERESRRRIVPIGRPISNTQVFLLDKNLRHIAIGMLGELYIGGDPVGRGYLNSPHLTAESYIPNPYSKRQGSRLYRTGDLARYLPDGVIEYIARIDHQIKLHGFRIELEEIEAVLSRHPSVRGAVVAEREYGPGQTQLVCYVVCRRKSPPSISELRSYAKERLPDYMVPAFVMLATLPLLPNGKVNRKALPDVEPLRRDLGSSYLAPRNEIEQAVASVWQEVLKVEKVGVFDNFFDLGGHSLLMFQMQAKMRKAFNRDLSAIDLFKYPTVSALAEYLRSESIEPPTFQQEYDQARRQREAMKRQSQLVHTGR